MSEDKTSPGAATIELPEGVPVVAFKDVSIKFDVKPVLRNISFSVERGQTLRDGLERLPHVVSVRGRGLMLACELDVAAPAVVARALHEQRLVINATGPTTLRLLPALNVDGAEVEEALRRLGAALED